MGHRKVLRNAALAIGSCGLAVCLLVALPRVLAVGWDDALDDIAGVGLADVAVISLLWAAGLLVHTMVLRRSLPGLTVRQALALNLGGSSVSNVLPFGGAAGIGLNTAMLQSWGYNATQISGFATVSNLVVAAVKVIIVVAGLIALSTMPAPPALPGGLTSPGSLAVVGVVLLAALLGGLTRRGRACTAALKRSCVQLWHHSASLVREGWRGLVMGGLGYPALQVLLFARCLEATGCTVSLGTVFAAYAIERAAGLVPLTPGGLGVVEASATAALIGFGADPVGAAAGVVLFRLFSFLIEIPLGGAVTAWWMVLRRRNALASA